MNREVIMLKMATKAYNYMFYADSVFNSNEEYDKVFEAKSGALM